jgi:hypothetical protein
MSFQAGGGVLGSLGFEDRAVILVKGSVQERIISVGIVVPLDFCSLRHDADFVGKR